MLSVLAPGHVNALPKFPVIANRSILQYAKDYLYAFMRILVRYRYVFGRQTLTVRDSATRMGDAIACDSPTRASVVLPLLS